MFRADRHTDGKTEVTKLRVAFRNFAKKKRPKMVENEELNTMATLILA